MRAAKSTLNAGRPWTARTRIAAAAARRERAATGTGARDSTAWRWFTPKAEMWLCGHATMATAHVLFNELGVEAPSVAFHTLSGVLKAVSEGRKVRLDFPRDDPTPIEAPHQLLEALGVEAPRDVVYGGDNKYLVVVAEDEETVRKLNPDIDAMGGMELPFEVKGVAVTS